MNIRMTVARDIAELKKVVDATELFPSEYLPEMIQPYLDDPSGGRYLAQLRQPKWCYRPVLRRNGSSHRWDVEHACSQRCA